MSFARGNLVTKTDLDALATLATTKLSPTAPDDDMGRTFDIQRASEPGYTPATMTGDFTFSTETETYPDPIGSPVVKAAPRWAWCDELNRIWKKLWNIPNSHSFVRGATYPFGYDGWDLWTGAANGVAWENIEGINGWWSTQALIIENDLRCIVCSPGPNLFTTLYDARPDDSLGGYARAYIEYYGLFSRYQTAFDIYGGLFTYELNEAGDNGYHPSSDPVLHYFGTVGVDAGAGIYGYYELEYSYTGTSNPPPDPTSGSGLYFNAYPGLTGNRDSSYDAVNNPKKFYIWFTDLMAGRGEDSILYTAGAGSHAAGTDNQEILSWVDEADWVFTRVKIRGGIYTATKPSSDGFPSTDYVIHPRNDSVRAALHIATTYDLEDADFLQFDTIDGYLSVPGTGTRVVDTALRAMLRQDTKDALDDYPLIQPDPSTARAELLADLNTLIHGDMDNSLYDLWIAAVEATVTLRASTQWMISRNSQDVEFLKRMRRLILEDVYAGSPLQLRRLTGGYSELSDEIRKINLPIASVGSAYWVGSDDPLNPGQPNPVGRLPLMNGSYYCSRQDVEIIYMGLGLPQWCSNTFLDYQMPDASQDVVGGTSGGPRGLAQWSADQNAWFRPAISPVPSNYPVFHRNWFGVLMPYSNRELRPNLWTRGYVPYWTHDEKHSWLVGAVQTALPPAAITYNTTTVFIAQDSIADGLRYEYTVSNSNLKIYVSATDFPDPTDPTTYLISNEFGRFVFPDEFSSTTGLDDGFHSLYITVENTTDTAQVWQEVISVFTPDGTEAANDPPNPIPRFFPLQEPQNGSTRLSATGVEPLGDSFLPGPSYNVANTNRPFPCPQRGQHVRELLIRRKPVMNAAGIYGPPDTSDMEEKKVIVGLMCGAGVISGAIYGAYPGDWMTLQTHTIPAATNELRVQVTYAVLQGAPLAYYVTTSGDVDDSEEFDIFASVEFQPGVNNTFAGGDDRTVGTSPPYTYLTGAFNGYPFVSNTYLYGVNWNVPTPISASYSSLRHGDYKIVQPPLSARCIKQVNDYINSL